MKPSVLLTKHALALLEAAMEADRKRIDSLVKKHKGSAEVLTPIMGALAKNQDRLRQITGAGLHGLDEAINVMTKNTHATKEIGRIRDHVTSVAAAVEEMAAAATEISRHAQSTVERAEESSERIAVGNEGVSSLMGDMDLLESAVRSMADGMEQFVSFASEINKLTATVRDIAHQTNLLALNAAIEAARAGEAGRGFAVVADEVKKLADKTADATTEIETVTDTMNALSDKVGTSVNNSLQRLAESVNALESVAMALAENGSVVRDVGERVQQIAASAMEQQTVAQEMASNLGSITESLSNENEQIASISYHAKQLTQALGQQFNLMSEGDNEELLLQVVKADHLLWKARLADMILGGEPMAEEQLKDHTQCRLGKWYYTTGKARYGHNGAFQAMENPHAEIHAIGKEIAQLTKQGHHEEAAERLERMVNLSQRLFEHIDKLTTEL